MRRYFCIFLISAVFCLGLWMIVKTIFAATTTTVPSRMQVVSLNQAPTVTSVAISPTPQITLTPNTTTVVYVTAIIDDTDECGDFLPPNGSSTILLYRAGITSSTCITTQNNLNCYRLTDFTATSTCISTTQINTTTTFNVWYFADATDSFSSYSEEGWKATVIVRDSANATGTEDSPGVQMNTTNAININTSSLNYGTVSPGENTGQTNQSAYVQNAGNSTTTLSLSGNSLSFGSNKLSTSSQHYATTTFTYGTSNEQALSDVLTTVSGFLISPPLIKFPEVSTWTYTASLPYTYEQHPSFAYNGYAYVVGGIPPVGGATSGVLFGPISSTGSIAYWTSTTSLPFTEAQEPSFAYNGYAYVVGGYANGEFPATSTVLFGPISSTGSIAYWTSTTALPFKEESHPSFAYNGYAYVVGGSANGAATSTVIFGPISSTGSISYWTSTTALPFTDKLHPSFAYNGYAYVVGGYANGTYTSTVLFGPISSTGSIAYWTSTAALPFTDTRHPSFAYNGYAYVVGGYANGAATSTVIFGPISSTGSIAYWTSTTALPFKDYNYPSFAYNGYAYVVGGYANSADTSTVLFAPLFSKPTYWGIGVATGTATGTYSGTNIFTVGWQ